MPSSTGSKTFCGTVSPSALAALRLTTEIPPRIDCRNGMVCRQRDELLASAGEERIGADEQRAGMKLDQGRKSGFDLTLSAGLKDMELDSLRARRLLRIS